MSEHIVKSYDDDLSTLKQQIVQMVGLCLKPRQIEIAIIKNI